jgi:hypothetical protein
LIRGEETYLRDFRHHIGIEEAPVFTEERHEHTIRPVSVRSPERNTKTQTSNVSGYCFDSATGACNHCVGGDVGLLLVAFVGEKLIQYKLKNRSKSR